MMEVPSVVVIALTMLAGFTVHMVAWLELGRKPNSTSNQQETKLKCFT